MKSALKTAANTILRGAAYWQMRSVEINLAGAIDTLPYVKDADTLDAMRLSIRRMSKELCRRRAQYQRFLPPGQRHTWEVA